MKKAKTGVSISKRTDVIAGHMTSTPFLSLIREGGESWAMTLYFKCFKVNYTISFRYILTFTIFNILLASTRSYNQGALWSHFNIFLSHWVREPKILETDVCDFLCHVSMYLCFKALLTFWLMFSKMCQKNSGHERKFKLL